MNCLNCSNPLKDGAKFCTGCGVKVEVANNVAPVSNVAVVNNAATVNSVNVSNNKSTTNEISVVKQRIVWNVQPGEISRLINENDFLQYQNAVGLIINEGTKALIRMNGEVIATLDSGSYDFLEKEEVLKLTEQHTNPIKRGINNAFRFIANLLSSKSEKKDNPNNEKKISKLQEGKIFSILLFLDVPFTLLYGAQRGTSDEYADFIPMNIRAKNLDVQLGLRASFRINNVQEFAKNYMYNKSVVTTADLVAISSHDVIAAVQDVMKSVEMTDNSIDDSTTNRITTHIKALSSNGLYGFGIEKLIEISTQNEDLERFRTLSQEMYLSERELEFLQRTSDFKNRLTDQENNQTINSAKNDLELFKSLQEVNKDKLLNEDELDKFYMLLSRERKIREAKNESEIETALLDIEKTGLIRDEDLDVLKHQITTNSHQRGFSLKLMQLKDSIAYNKSVQDSENEMAINYVKAEIDQSRVRDDYEDERFRKQVKREEEAQRTALDLGRQQAEMQLDIKERESKSQMDGFMKMAELKQQMQKQQHDEDLEKKQLDLEHEKKMQGLKTEDVQMRYHNAQTLSAEQLMALAANENLDADASREFARSFNSGKEAEYLKEQSGKLENLNQARVDDMKEMMREMMANNRMVTSSLAESKDRSKEEYKERLDIEQQRLDRTQDQALNYTTRNNIGTQQQYQQPPQQQQQQQQQQQYQQPQQQQQYQQQQSNISGSKCPHCNVVNGQDVRFCEDCGNEINGR